MTDFASKLSPLAFWWLPPAALFLELAFVHPLRLPHPVRAIGWLADRLEGPARRLPFPVLAGAAALAVVLAVAGIAAGLLISLPGLLGLAAALYAGSAALALGCLAREGQKALESVKSGNLDEARRAVGMLVSRDTSGLEEQPLYRTLAETLAENFNDAFVAPFFWLLWAGPVGVWAYKAASTMDSMWGYKNERWLLLGRASARLDDVLAFVPARISALLLCLTARGFADFAFSRAAWKRMGEDARRMSSPNAGWPMAAAAWIYAARMGGPAVYHGTAVEKPRLGPEAGEWNAEKVERLIRHIRFAGLAGGWSLWALWAAAWPAFSRAAF